MDAEKIEPGQTVQVRAVVWDKREVNSYGQKLGPQEIAGPTGMKSPIVSKDDEAAAALKRLDSLRAELMKILEKQIRARTIIKPRPTVATKISRRPSGEGPGVRAASEEVRPLQIDIQKSSAALAESIVPAGHKSQPTIKRVLGELAAGEMIEAVRLCDEIRTTSNDNSTSENSRGLTAPGEKSEHSRPSRRLLASGYFNEQLDKLTTVQDRIIDALRDLLNIARRAQADLLAEMAKRPGGDLPDDTKQKLEELRDKLDSFLEQQKR